jgi:hypothetical protein
MTGLALGTHPGFAGYGVIGTRIFRLAVSEGVLRASHHQQYRARRLEGGSACAWRLAVRHVLAANTPRPSSSEGAIGSPVQILGALSGASPPPPRIVVGRRNLHPN